MNNEERQGVQSVEEHIRQCIHVMRGCKVILDQDLAALYEVENRALLQATKRNIDRFPEDFMIQLTKEEWAILRSQIVISSGWGSRAARRLTARALFL